MTKFITRQDNVQKKKKGRKKTVLTHLFSGSIGFVECENSFVSDYEIVDYLGNCSIDGDMFACYHKGTISIFKGIKGDEFND